jgi:hypothetical protein
MNVRGRGRPLRFRLFLLAASGLLPLAIAAGVVLAYVSGGPAMRKRARFKSPAHSRQRWMRNCGRQ